MPSVDHDRRTDKGRDKKLEMVLVKLLNQETDLNEEAINKQLSLNKMVIDEVVDFVSS